jgi:hypothetical protein
MDNPVENVEGDNRFYLKYSDFTDAQILEILRTHKDYQDQAVTAAVKIAIERQLIHSEQDLMSPEFQYTKIDGFTIFPVIGNVFHQVRLIASIFRFLYILSLIPIIYGIMQYAEGNLNQTILGIAVGVVWLSLSLLLNKTRKLIFNTILILILVIITFSAGNRVFAVDSHRFMDLFMLLVGFLLSAYFLLYLRKLIQTKS